jgi:8-oxo-dGTP diphosphatase
MGVILYIISLLISVILLPIGLVYTIFISIYKRRFFAEGIPTINLKFKKLATAVDIYGNVACSELFNDVLIKKDSIDKFGNYGETISSVIGKNKLTNTLTKTGVLLDKILDFFDPNHSIKSIKRCCLKFGNV